MFLLYDVINQRRSSLGYHLLTKTCFWEQPHAQVDSLSLEDLNKVATEIKTTRKCTNPAILTLERQVQIVASRSPHSFAKCAKQNLFIRLFMISDRISTIWITLNPSGFRSFLVLILADVCFEDSGSSTSAKEFRRTTVVMNPVAVAQFFEATCTGIFKRLLVARSTGGDYLGLFQPTMEL